MQTACSYCHDGFVLLDLRCIISDRETFLCVVALHCGVMMTVKFDTIKMSFVNLILYCHFSINAAT